GAGGGTNPAAGVSVSGGYVVARTDRLEVRVGAKVGYSYLSDVASTDHLISLLADPILRVRLWEERLYFFGELGVGALIINGLTKGSSMLEVHALPSGSFTAFELRPA